MSRRYLLYSFDNGTLGHGRRCMNIATAIAAADPEARLLLVSSADLLLRGPLPPRLDVLRLPGVTRASFERPDYVSERWGDCGPWFWRLREGLLREALRAHQLFEIDIGPGNRVAGKNERSQAEGHGLDEAVVAALADHQRRTGHERAGIGHRRQDAEAGIAECGEPCRQGRFQVGAGQDLEERTPRGGKAAPGRQQRPQQGVEVTAAATGDEHAGPGRCSCCLARQRRRLHIADEGGPLPRQLEMRDGVENRPLAVDEYLVIDTLEQPPGPVTLPFRQGARR
jgi:hypothetical protein